MVVSSAALVDVLTEFTVEVVTIVCELACVALGVDCCTPGSVYQ